MYRHFRGFAGSDCRYNGGRRLSSSASAIKGNIARRKSGRIQRNYGGNCKGARRSDQFRLDHCDRYEASARRLCNSEIVRARQDWGGFSVLFEGWYTRVLFALLLFVDWG